MRLLDLPAASGRVPDPDVVRETAREVLARAHFQTEPTSGGVDLLGLFWSLLVWMIRPFAALFGALWEISPLLAWVVISLLVLLLIALIAHIAYTFKVALARRAGIQRIDLRTAEERRDPAEFERLADASVDAGDYAEAARLLLRACLLRLELHQDRPFRRGTTNREHLRRYRESPMSEPLRSIVDLIDRTWYGNGVCLAENFAACRQAYESIRAGLKETPRAHRP